MSVLLAEPLTASSAVDIAVLNSPKLRVILEELGIASAELAQARRPPNPLLEAEVRAPGNPFELHLMQQVLELIQLPKRRRIAAAEFEEAKLRIVDDVLAYIHRVRGAYYAAQADEQAVEARRTALATAEVAVELASRQLEAGNISALALDRQHAALDEARLELTLAEQSLVQSREELNVLLGLFGSQTQWTLAAGFTDLPQEESAERLEEAALTQRVDVALAHRHVDTLARRAKLSRSETFADTEVGMHHEREPSGDSSTGPVIALPLPIFDSGGPARKRALALVRQAQQRQLALDVAVRADVRATSSRMQAARERAAYYREVVLPRRSRIVESMQREYNFMLTGVFELLAARREEVAARLDYIEALREYWTARVDLERAIGAPLATEHDVRSTADSQGGS